MRHSMRARAFVPASDQYMGVGDQLVDGPPLTMATWFLSTDVTVNQCLMGNGDAEGGATDGYVLFAVGGVAGDPVGAFSVVANDTSVVAVSTAGFMAGMWGHAGGVWRTASSRAAFFGGANKGTNGSLATPMGMDRFEVGRYPGFGVNELAGRLFLPAVWAAALTDGEMWELGCGRWPWLVRPQSLVACWDATGRNMVGNRFGLAAVNAPGWAGAPGRMMRVERRRLALPLAGGQPMSLRGAGVPGMRQWQPRVGG